MYIIIYIYIYIYIFIYINYRFYNFLIMMNFSLIKYRLNFN